MNKQTYILDNAAKIYPAAMTKKWNSVFRVAVYLRSNIDPKILSYAVSDLYARFPSFYVQLHKGAFWDSLVPVPEYDTVEPDTEIPCRPFEVGKGNKPLFRVLYGENRIAVEFFHSVTDGNGAMVYLKTLTARYLELQGYQIEKTDGVLDIYDIPSESETADAFQSIYKKSKRVSRKEENAYQYNPERAENYYRVVSAVMSLDSLKAAAKKYDCTITAYLAGIYAFTFLAQFRKNNPNGKMNKPVKISIPVNLRPYYNKNTLRNFASFVNVAVRPDENKTLEDAIMTVKREMDDLIQIEKIEKTVNQNVAEEKMLISRIAPNVLKKMVMKACFMQFGEKKYTAPFSNLGKVKVPASMRAHVERFEFLIGKTVKNDVYLTGVGYENTMTLTFGAVTKNTEIEDMFIDILRKDGVMFTLERLDDKKVNYRTA